MTNYKFELFQRGDVIYAWHLLNADTGEVLELGTLNVDNIYDAICEANKIQYDLCWEYCEQCVDSWHINFNLSC